MNANKVLEISIRDGPIKFQGVCIPEAYPSILTFPRSSTLTFNSLRNSIRIQKTNESNSEQRILYNNVLN